tara:strand:- start:4181 stop:4411 length:231 start_codon:yes stop_codon:yes gene_type:complete
MLNVSAVALDMGLTESQVKSMCRQYGVKVTKGVGFYLIDEEHLHDKIGKSAKVQKKRTISKSHLKKMMDAKAAKKN